MTAIILLLAVFWIAYSNGANDNFKGVATLYGSSAASFKKALAWATVSTGAGSLVSVAAAGKFVAAFTGRGLIPDGLAGTPPVLIAVGIGSALTICLATRMGLPTSTTHALTGSLVGIAAAGSIHRIGWETLLSGFAGPMLLSPALAALLAAAAYPMLRRVGAACGVTRQTCLCIGEEAPIPVRVREDGSVALAASSLRVRLDQLENCEERYVGKFIGVDAQSLVTGTHYVSAGAVCFSRAVNDTPKIAALLLATQGGASYGALGWVAAAMLMGGWLHSRRVAETLSHRIADLSPGQGLIANLATAFLVLAASNFGLPVSTTHVSVGAIFGIGAANRTCRWKTVAEIAAAWLITLPLAGLLSGLLFLLATRLP
ncbi:MAG: inorganic phosphate transporter [Candidatus Tectomicrobia bacterium]|nr:inorganic phosphate transporter [Candidatus Tectomicrobia bacterium]